LRDVTEVMEDWPLTVPVKVDCEVGDDWGHLDEVDVRQLASI
jgi:hypothetical protein